MIVRGCVNCSFVVAFFVHGCIIVRSRLRRAIAVALFDGCRQEPKKHPNQTFWGNFIDRNVWGNFGQWGVKQKFGCSGFAVSFFSLWGHAPLHNEKWDCKSWTPKLFLDPPLSKMSPNFSVYKISQKVRFGFSNINFTVNKVIFSRNLTAKWWKMSIQIIKMWLTVVYFLIFLVYQFLVMLQTSFFDYFLWLVLSLFSIWYCLYIGWMQILSI